MSDAQLTAFQAGSGVTANTLLLGIAASVLVLAFVWVLWITFGSFKAWQAGDAALFDLAWNAIRASIVLMVLGFYLN
ncbi:MAG: TIGR03758 family integrating conjugative element protein [Woeseia sp.]